jgi:hydroxypyruvate isomerase
VEYLFPYEFSAHAIADQLQQHGLTQALFNLPAGDWAAGDRGMACQPGREAEFEQGLALALKYAKATGCRRLHAMAGLAPVGVSEATRQRTYVANLKSAAQTLAPHGITLLIEPINTRDMPGYHLNRQQHAHDTVADVNEPLVQVQMDFYHCQIMEGDLTRRLERHCARVGHIQIAGVPDRHEPDHGEVHYPFVFQRLDELGYSGFVGCEYRPRGDTSAGLAWFEPWRASQQGHTIHGQLGAVLHRAVQHP